MPIPRLETFPPATVNLDPSVQGSLPVMAWMQQYFATQIPGDSVAWMLAQGWQIASVSYDSSTTPPTPYYSMTREGMANSAVLQSLVNVYTNAYNEGRAMNASRYDNIVANWSSLIGSTVADMSAQTAEYNAFSAAYLGRLDNEVSEIESYLTAERTQIQADYAVLRQKVDAYALQLPGLQTNYAAHEARFRGLLDFLLVDWVAHSGLATAFLTGLGATETVRINEQFDNRITTAQQELVNRGLYSSARIVPLTTRIERERNEALAALNDRLNREKLENEHKLYEQKVSVRTQLLQGDDKLFAELQEATQQILEGTAKSNQLLQSNSEYRAAGMHRLVSLQMEAKFNRLRIQTDEQAQEMKLLQYQIDTVNNLVIGLFGFQEKRTDSYPSLEIFAQLCSQLGDSSATSWVTP